MKLVAVIEAHVCHALQSLERRLLHHPKGDYSQSPQSRDSSPWSPSGNINESNYELQEYESVIGGMTLPIPTLPTTHSHSNSLA